MLCIYIYIYVYMIAIWDYEMSSCLIYRFVSSFVLGWVGCTVFCFSSSQLVTPGALTGLIRSISLDQVSWLWRFEVIPNQNDLDFEGIIQMWTLLIIFLMPKAASKGLATWKWPITEPLGLLFKETFHFTTYIGFIPPMSPIREKIHQGSVRFLHSDVLWVFVRRRFFRWCGDEKPIHEDLNVTWTVRQRGLIKKEKINCLRNKGKTEKKCKLWEWRRNWEWVIHRVMPATSAKQRQRDSPWYLQIMSC